MSIDDFEPVIGLEVHAQIATKTKLFCRCTTDSWKLLPNTAVCPICMGFPGQLPVLNEAALKKAIVAALALGCNIPSHAKFDRKNYFYPDLPKGFQISQYDEPISKNGAFEIALNGTRKTVRINRLHVEDDAGKLTHVSDGTLCDFNRSGVPLMEIVSEPDLFSVEEASAYVRELRRLLRYCGASECDMEKGMMRFDINVSLRKKGSEALGTKIEMKNLNSFKALENALRFEIARQADVLAGGGTLRQETRGWDEAGQETVSQRSKEEAHDYRYFPEPDLPPIEMVEKEIAVLRTKVPELPLARRSRFVQQFGVNEEDAHILTEERSTADFFETAVALSNDGKRTAAFMAILANRLQGESFGNSPVSAEHLGKLAALVAAGKLNMNLAKGEVFEEMYTTGKDPETIITEKGLSEVGDEDELAKIVEKVIATNPKPAEDVRGGKQEAIGFLMGQVMQKTRGRANPQNVQKLLREKLSS